MGWLRLLGSFKIYVSFAEYSLFYRALLQKRPIILKSHLIVAHSCIAQSQYSTHSSAARLGHRLDDTGMQRSILEACDDRGMQRSMIEIDRAGYRCSDSPCRHLQRMAAPASAPHSLPLPLTASVFREC